MWDWNQEEKSLNSHYRSLTLDTVFTARNLFHLVTRLLSGSFVHRLEKLWRNQIFCRIGSIYLLKIRHSDVENLKFSPRRCRAKSQGIQTLVPWYVLDVSWEGVAPRCRRKAEKQWIIINLVYFLVSESIVNLLHCFCLSDFKCYCRYYCCRYADEHLRLGQGDGGGLVDDPRLGMTGSQLSHGL